MRGLMQAIGEDIMQIVGKVLASFPCHVQLRMEPFKREDASGTPTRPLFKTAEDEGAELEIDFLSKFKFRLHLVLGTNII
jgi:hypothetical protein